MSSHTAELKAALPSDFSGKNDDATQWIKAMKAYFTLNATLYSSDAAKIMTTDATGYRWRPPVQEPNEGLEIKLEQGASRARVTTGRVGITSGSLV